MKLKFLLCLLVFSLCGARAAETGDLEFLEAFAWGDREAALKELVPDTEDYYYYHCLHYQLSNQRAKFDDMLRRWVRKNDHRWNDRMKEMRRRQMLMEFERTPKEVWEFLKDDNNLHFNHRPRHAERSREYPSVVRPEQYAESVFLARASRHGRLLDRVTERGLEVAARQELTPEQRRALLGQLERPDVPGLVDLILADLDYKDSRGFGHHRIHRLLTRVQLEELGRRRPALLRDRDYVTERLSRIQPPKVDLSHDHEAAVAYYRDMWSFVQTLGEMHNSLKASTLYRLLDHLRQTGDYDEGLFRAYVALPRPVAYLDEDRRERLRGQRVEWVNFNFSPGREIVLPPVGNEEPLVRDYLIELFRDDADMEGYARFFESDWLKAVFAESKILHGVGKPEAWAHLLSPEAYRRILERIELQFAPDNPSYVTPGDAVSLKVEVKRVDEVLVKIYEMQTFNYYTTHQAPVDQAVDLDGMVATHERTMTVSADPGRRVVRTLDLPEIDGRGVYVVELIGNGVSSRALVHVGHLEMVSQATAAGQVAMVLNDAGETVKDARIWLDGREFEANERGLILLPFSENPGTRFAVLRDGTFSSPEQFTHLGESYRFSAGILLDPQSMNRRDTARLILRPDLRIHDLPLDPGMLKDVKVTLAVTDAKGIRSEREFLPEFVDSREWAKDFYVPDGLRSVEVSVTATLKRKTDLEEESLTDHKEIQVKSGRSGDVLKQVFLVPSTKGWSLEVRDLNGALIPEVPLRVDLWHPAFKEDVTVRTTTDPEGRVELGSLANIHRIRVSGPDALALDQMLDSGAAVLPDILHLQPGEAVSLPYPYDSKAELRRASLFRMGRGLILEDAGDKARIGGGELRIDGLAEGEYRLTLHEPGETVTLRVVEGESRSGFILGETERLQRTGLELTSVEDVTRSGESVKVKLRHVRPGTRVAVRAYRFAGNEKGIPIGMGYASPSFRRVFPPHVQYVSGRNIGDEYRYVLERQSLDTYAGTLLERPGLILNPWELRETEAERERLKQDEAYRGGRQRLNAPEEDGVPAGADRFSGGVHRDALMAKSGRGSGRSPSGNDIGFDFLPEGSRWWVNLVPGEDGTVSVPLEGLEEQTALDVVVMTRFGTVLRRVPLPENAFEPREVRLTAGLKPEGSFSRQKQIRAVDAGEATVFPDLATTRYQVIGDVGLAFDLLQTLHGGGELRKFAFLKDWPDLDREARLEKYNEYACHELHLFLYRRDPEFFESVVAPYLKNKKDKTFVDRWLLGELTPEDTRLDRLQHRNALELALLARRGGDAEAMRALLRERVELLPPDPEGFAERVRTALQSNQLDEAVAQARDEARERAERQSEVVSMSGMLVSQDSARARAPMASEKPMKKVEQEEMEDQNLSFALGETKAEGAERHLMELGKDADGFSNEQTRLYRKLPKTKELAEQNYWHVRMREDVPERIPVNAFWLDVARGKELSPHLLRANGTLTEAVVALAFSGLPFEAEAPEETQEGAALTLRTSSPALLVSEQILPAEPSEDERPLLLSQQFFRPDDRYRFEGNEQIEKFVSGEFIRRTVYGARVTLTNPTSSKRRLNVLLQIPVGAIPVRNGFYTDDHSVVLDPYTTRTVEYFFMFPESGTFSQFPAHAAAEEAIIGRAEPRMFEVVDAPTEVDKTSWAWVSQHASDAETLVFLRDHNLRRLELNEMAWRLKDKNFYREVVGLLTSRGLFHDLTFSYALEHRDPDTARVWLAQSSTAKQVGPVLRSPLLVIDPGVEKTYEHLEYAPLVNPRAHDVGAKRKILNHALRDQYRSFLFHNLYRAELDAHERLALVYYLQVQGRLGEAMAQFDRIETEALHEDLQTDYLAAWLALRSLEVDRALALAEPHTDHPVPRWRRRFREVVRAVEEARGGEVGTVEDPTRQQDLDRMASKQPSLELKEENGVLWLTGHHLETVTLNLYPMDIELLFSRKPFLAEGGEDFAVIRPAFSQEIDIKGGGEEERLDLPEAFRNRNVMVEVTGKGKRASTAWYANRLKIRKMEEFGQIAVRSEETGEPLPKTYVKVFARGVNGRVSFWKDGYTDLRGRFDYLSLNHREPEEAAEFSILVLHPEAGAEILEATPPTR